MQKQIENFFETHPDSDVVYEALGFLFTTAEGADGICAGTTATPVAHQRSDYETSIPDEPEVPAKPKEQKPSEPASEDLPIVHNDATTYGKTAEEVAELNEVKKKPAKKAAKK